MRIITFLLDAIKKLTILTKFYRSPKKLLLLKNPKYHAWHLFLQTEQMTWKQAQVYCTANHIDLATVQNDEDWANLRDVVQKMTKTAWIGLYNDINSWQWSYQNKEIAFRSWSSGEPNNYGGYEACGLTYGSSWNDYDCNSLLPFFCFNAVALQD
uniref:C-type lectin domain-containing protein n=1 Tax=Cyprinus carpio TaxID=7962 RepID=A0A8C2FB45_CYPCA